MVLQPQEKQMSINTLLKDKVEYFRHGQTMGVWSSKIIYKVFWTFSPRLKPTDKSAKRLTSFLLIFEGGDDDSKVVVDRQCLFLCLVEQHLHVVGDGKEDVCIGANFWEPKMENLHSITHRTIILPFEICNLIHICKNYQHCTLSFPSVLFFSRREYRGGASQTPPSVLFRCFL